MDERHGPNRIVADEMERNRESVAEHLYQNYEAFSKAGSNEDQVMKTICTITHAMFAAMEGASHK